MRCLGSLESYKQNLHQLPILASSGWWRAAAGVKMLSSVPSKRALQQFRDRAKSRRISMTTLSEFCDRAGDAVLLQIVFSCDDPGDMFNIIVSIMRVVGAQSSGAHRPGGWRRASEGEKRIRLCGA